MHNHAMRVYAHYRYLRQQHKRQPTLAELATSTQLDADEVMDRLCDLVEANWLRESVIDELEGTDDPLHAFSERARTVLLYIAHHQRTHGVAPTRWAIRDGCKVSWRTVMKALSELAAHKVVEGGSGPRERVRLLVEVEGGQVAV